MMDAKSISEIVGAACTWVRTVIPAVDGIQNLAEADRDFINTLIANGAMTQDEINDLEPYQ